MLGCLWAGYPMIIQAGEALCALIARAAALTAHRRVISPGGLEICIERRGREQEHVRLTVSLSSFLGVMHLP